MQNNLPARHAFTDIVVGIARERQFNPGGIPDPETLPGGAGKMQFQRRSGDPAVAVQLCHKAGERSTHRAVGIADIIIKGTGLLCLHTGPGIFQDAAVQFTLIKRRIGL